MLPLLVLLLVYVLAGVLITNGFRNASRSQMTSGDRVVLVAAWAPLLAVVLLNRCGASIARWNDRR